LIGWRGVVGRADADRGAGVAGRRTGPVAGLVVGLAAVLVVGRTGGRTAGLGLLARPVVGRLAAGRTTGGSIGGNSIGVLTLGGVRVTGVRGRGVELPGRAAASALGSEDPNSPSYLPFRAEMRASNESVSAKALSSAGVS